MENGSNEREYAKVTATLVVATIALLVLGFARQSRPRTFASAGQDHKQQLWRNSFKHSRLEIGLRCSKGSQGSRERETRTYRFSAFARPSFSAFTLLSAAVGQRTVIADPPEVNPSQPGSRCLTCSIASA
jgi:hypothetical protein